MSSANDPSRPDGQIYENMIRRAISRYWGERLSPVEQVVLYRLVDVTWGWDRPSYVCSLANLIGRLGSWKGCGVSTSGAKLVLKSLVDRGLIEMVGSPKGTRFTVIAERILHEVDATNTEADDMPIPIPKREKLVTQCPTDSHSVTNPWSASDQPLVTQWPTYKNTLKNPEEEPTLQDDGCADTASAIASRSSSPEKALAEKITGVIAARKAKVSTASEKALEALNAGTAKNVPLAMLHVINGSIPDGQPKVTWASRHYGMAKNVAVRWHPSMGGIGDFCAWVAAEWNGRLKRRFRWMKNREFPGGFDVQFLLWALDYGVFDAYMDRTKTERENDLKLSYFEQQLSKGVPIEEIVKAAEKVAFEKGEASGKQTRPYQPTMRPRPRSLQPVATDEGLREREMTPKHVTLDANVDDEGYRVYTPKQRRDFGAYEE